MKTKTLHGDKKVYVMTTLKISITINKKSMLDCTTYSNAGQRVEVFILNSDKHSFFSST